MKIAFVIYGLGAGGAERAVTGLANHWTCKHDVVIITLVKTDPFYKLDLRVRQQYCLKTQQINTNFVKSSINVSRRILRLIKILKKEQPDVLLSFTTTPNIYAIWMGKLLKIPCIISERANHNVDKLPKTQEKVRNFSYRRLYKLIVQTQGNKKYYKALIPENKIVVIPNGVSENLQKSKKVKLENKEKIILNVGAFRDGKAQDDLIKAFAKVNNNQWQLIFLGDGPNLGKFKMLARQLNIFERIQFLGAKKNVADYYNKASVFVFTSRHEGFPNALLEALYFGLPSISTDCPHGPSDLIKDGTNGFLVSVGNQEELCNKLNLLLDREDLRYALGKAAAVRSKKYEISTIAEQWMNVIESVIA